MIKKPIAVGRIRIASGANVDLLYLRHDAIGESDRAL